MPAPGGTLSPESRARIAAARRAKLADPAERKLMSERVRGAWRDPEKAARMMRRQVLPDIPSMPSGQRDIYRLYRKSGYDRASAFTAAQGDAS